MTRVRDVKRRIREIQERQGYLCDHVRAALYQLVKGEQKIMAAEARLVDSVGRSAADRIMDELGMRW